MPGTDLPLEQLRSYRGSSPCPEDFSSFWRDVAAELQAHDQKTSMERVELGNSEAEYYRVTITAPDGCPLEAKYIRPSTPAPVPLMLQFHDYPGASRSWFHLTRYNALGWAVLAPDCRGLGGPLFGGLEGNVKDLYLFRLFQDALLWAKTARELLGATELSLYGEGLGGGLALGCSALYPDFRKCAVHYPTLCDYRRMWELGFDENTGLREFFRWHDPLHRQEEEIFQKLSYVDIQNFAPLVRSKVLMSTGLLDAVSPPSAQFAVYNGLQTEKQHLVYPKHGHELNNFFENALLKFLIEN